MSKITLTRVFRTDVDTKYGIKPKVAIQTQEHGEKWLSTFKVVGTEKWEEGMEVEVNIQEKGDFLNFSVVGGATITPNPLEERITKLEERVKELEDEDGVTE